MGGKWSIYLRRINTFFSGEMFERYMALIFLFCEAILDSQVRFQKVFFTIGCLTSLGARLSVGRSSIISIMIAIIRVRSYTSMLLSKHLLHLYYSIHYLREIHKETFKCDRVRTCRIYYTHFYEKMALKIQFSPAYRQSSYSH